MENDFSFVWQHLLICLCLFVCWQTKLTSVSLRGISASSSNNDISGNDFHGNYAFEGIGDDDLWPLLQKLNVKEREIECKMDRQRTSDIETDRQEEWARERELDMHARVNPLIILKIPAELERLPSAWSILPSSNQYPLAWPPVISRSLHLRLAYSGPRG